MRGLNQFHRKPSVIGTTAHQPSHNRHQNAMIRTGSTVLRRITLHGLAWRIHAVSSSLNTCAIVRSMVIRFYYTVFCYYCLHRVGYHYRMLPAGNRMTDGRDDALSCYRKYCMDNLALNNQITPVTTGHVFLVILTTAHVRSNLPIKKAYEGLL